MKGINCLAALKALSEHIRNPSSELRKTAFSRPKCANFNSLTLRCLCYLLHPSSMILPLLPLDR